MSRLGCLLLAGFAIVIGGFFALVRYQHGAPVVQRPADTIRLSAARAPAVAIPTGGLVIPVSGVQATQLSDTWGDARGDGTRSHHAIDIVAPRGTPVVAAAAGTVEKIFESKDGGHTIYVRRSDPAWIDYYAHLDAYAPNLREGMKVTPGQLLGAVGSTGDADAAAPHLHYEIKQMAPGEGYWQGTEIDPYPILAGKPAAR